MKKSRQKRGMNEGEHPYSVDKTSIPGQDISDSDSSCGAVNLEVVLGIAIPNDGICPLIEWRLEKDSLIVNI